MTTLDTYLGTLNPMRAARARAALVRSVRFNGSDMVARHVVIESMITDGATLGVWHGMRTLVRPCGSFLAEDQIGRTALAYASHILGGSQ